MASRWTRGRSRVEVVRVIRGQFLWESADQRPWLDEVEGEATREIGGLYTGTRWESRLFIWRVFGVAVEGTEDVGH